MRGLLSLVASAVAGMAAIASTWSFPETFVPFYVGLTFAGGVQAWAVRQPHNGRRAWLGSVIAALWVGTAVSAGALLMMEGSLLASSGPPQGREALFLGVPATAYRAIGLFGGALVSAVAAWLPGSWLREEVVVERGGT